MSEPTLFKMRIYSSCLPRPESTAIALMEDISFDIALPYIPQVGSSISVTPNHEYGKVIDVFHSPYLTDEYERISVHLEYPGTIDDFATLAAEGWKSS